MAGFSENTTYHISTDEIIDICKRQGVAYESSGDVSIAGDGTLKTVFKTGSKPVLFYSRRVSYNGEGLNAYVYRGPTYTGGTETLDITNPNDINPQDNESVFLSGATITNDGVLSRSVVYVYGNESNQGQGNALELIEDPQKIPPNSEILFVLENRDSQSQDVASMVQWVEPTRIPGIVLDDDGNFVRYSGKTL